MWQYRRKFVCLKNSYPLRGSTEIVESHEESPDRDLRNSNQDEEVADAVDPIRIPGNTIRNKMLGSGKNSLDFICIIRLLPVC